MDAQLTQIERFLIRIICVLALVAVGFAHKVPTPVDTSAAAEFAQYMMPDGNLPTLCITSTDDHAHDGDKGSRDHVAGGDCEACRLAASVLVPQQADIVGHPARFYARPYRIVGGNTPMRRLFPSHGGPRAPPFPLRHIG